ncbi:hypothetical protein V1L54_18895 [Streptomyces sp. TRM 70361]|uniref:hypothetical protein n=1 Tax=Streptomyces sp. TRM 70361 TaxID=3116553 RepID=UPI002E7B84AC|nr:hypothetical protein [Streptomyces sp. TRM 70361]MEE1941448.1 hypothetical protein [Streptomyces sp. TRM 70361]
MARLHGDLPQPDPRGGWYGTGQEVQDSAGGNQLSLRRPVVDVGEELGLVGSSGHCASPWMAR